MGSMGIIWGRIELYRVIWCYMGYIYIYIYIGLVISLAL